MTLAINRDIIAWALAVVQPATVADVYNFLCHVLKDKNTVPSRDDIANEIRAMIELQDVIKVIAKPSRYSVTAKGNHRFNKRLRHLRDRMRLFLLKHAYSASISKPSAVLLQDMDDVSSSTCTAAETKDGLRPNDRLVADQTAIWSLVSEQFRIGPKNTADGTPLFNHLAYYSFEPEYFGGSLKKTSELAEAIGISTRLITSIVKNKQKHYRTFPLAKKAGGVREINAPRTFLKVIQRWIADFVLNGLPVHNQCFAYRTGLSIKDNAAQHVGKKYVLSIDIEDFFGNIRKEQIEDLLLQQQYASDFAKIVAEICTLDGVTPQGAPSSPVLSNAILYDVDHAIGTLCSEEGLSYSRYADDICISGDNRDLVIGAKLACIEAIQLAGFKVKESKTRLSNRGRRQIVTGVVVNEKAQPPRKYRREVRALLARAKKSPDSYFQSYKEIAGKVYYLKSFNAINETKLIEYKQTLRTLKKLFEEHTESPQVL